MYQHLTSTLDRHEHDIDELSHSQAAQDVQLGSLATKVDERFDRVDERFDHMDTKIDDISKTISRLAWIVVTAVVVAALHLVLK